MIKKGQVSLVHTYSYDRDLYTQGLEVASDKQLNMTSRVLTVWEVMLMRVMVGAWPMMSKKIAFG